MRIAGFWRTFHFSLFFIRTWPWASLLIMSELHFPISVGVTSPKFWKERSDIEGAVRITRLSGLVCAFLVFTSSVSFSMLLQHLYPMWI